MRFFKQKRNRRSARTAVKRKRIRRIETLETRRVLATYFVDSTADNTTGSCLADQAGSGSCTLRLAIEQAEANPGADTIQIADGTYQVDSLIGSLNLSNAQSTSFVGNINDPTAVVIDGIGVSRIFQITGASAFDVSFEGLTIQNGFASDGSGGGGINAPTGFANLSLTNVIMQNNVAAENGSNPGVFSSGGAIAIAGNLTIINSTLQNNSSTLHGGGIDYSGVAGQTLTIRDSTISGNTAGDPLRVSGAYTGIGYGGGVNLNGTDTAIFENVTITGNSAGDSGGGVAAFSVPTSFTNTDFIDNTAQGSDSGGGGLFQSGGSTNIRGGRFQNNRSVAGGGGLETLNAPGFIDGTTFNLNQVTGTGTAFEDGGGAVVIVSSPVTLQIDSSPVTLQNVSITNNTAPSGGGVAIVDSNVTITDSTIADNIANSVATGGGGIGAIDRTGVNDNTLTITRTTISGNTTAAEGGGIGAVDMDLSISQTTIDGNRANGGRAGGIGLAGNNRTPTLTASQTTISNNQASADGGGLALARAGLSFENVTISTNTSVGGSGGGIGYDNNDASVIRRIAYSTIVNNVAPGLGSNIAGQGQSIDIEGSIFAGGVGAAFPGPFNSLGGNLDDGTSMGFSGPGDLNNTNPLLGPLADNFGTVFTHALLVGSLAIDAGTATLLAVDARGALRPMDGDGDSISVNDIGAFEAEQTAVALIVDNTTDVDDGDFSLGNLSLREAIRLANNSPDPDAITFDANVFGSAQTITLSGTQLVITQDVTITGPGEQLLTISGNDASRIFDIDGATTEVTLSGMTMSSGRAVNSNGGAIRSGAILSIIDSTVSGNIATDLGSTGYGGGIDSSGSLTLTRTNIINNQAENDGGGLNVSGILIMNDSTVAQNTASSHGGGIATFAGQVDITNSEIVGNSSGSAGGGIFNSEGQVSVADSVISGNTTSGGALNDGGGVFNYGDGTVNLTNTTISGNRADRNGGGISNGFPNASGGGGTVVITNSTIVGNQSDQLSGAGSGGGLWAASDPSVITRLFNTIIAGNTTGMAVNAPNDLGGQPVDSASAHNLIGDPASAGGLVDGSNGNIVGDGIGGVIQLDTILNPTLADNGGPTQTHLLVAGSRAIDAADPVLAPATDQRGISRPVDGDGNGSAVPDIGSIEAESVVPGVFSIDPATLSVGEGDGTATFTVNRTGGSDGAVSVAFTTANGTATAGSDYTATTGTLNFADGVTSQTITVSITEDTAIEGNETFTLTISTPTGGATLGAATVSNVTILDNDITQPGVLSIDPATLSVGEGDGTATFTVNRTGGSDGAVSVAFTTANGTANAGSDYTATTGTLNFADGITSQTITVPITDDAAIEGNETFTLTINTPTGGATLGATTVSNVTILDNDITQPGVLSIDPATLSVGEGDGTATFTVNRTGGSDGAASVAFTTANGTANAGSDYTATTGTLNFADGVTSQTITVPITDDMANEGNETFTLTISTPSGGATLGATTVSNVTILDNDGGVPPATLSGHVSCDINGNGTEDIGESVQGTVVFLDANGNRLLDAGEPSTLTDFPMVTTVFTSVIDPALVVVVEVPASCVSIPSNPGVSRSTIDGG